MTKTEIAKMAKDKGFVPQFIGDKETGLFTNPPTPMSYPKEDLRYFLHLCEIMYWLIEESNTTKDNSGAFMGIEDTVLQLLQNK
jgi:hypothetical protein